MNFRTILEIENDIQNKQTELDQTTHEIGRSILINAIADLEIEKKNAEEALSQQSLQERVEQAKETGYIFNELETSNGVKLPELSYSPENNELQAIAVQRFALAQEDAFNAKLNAMEYELTQERILNNDLNDHIEQIEREKRQAHLENVELQNNLRNATNIIAENELEIKQQAKRISELLEQQAGSAVPIAPLSQEERETKLMADVMGKQIKVTNVKPKNDTFANKMFTATNAVTGAEIEDHYIYLSLLGENKPKRYEEIGIEEATQLAAEYANKKAEIELSIPVLATPDIQPVTLLSEQEAPAEENSFQESNQVDATAVGLVDQSQTEVGESSEESEVKPVMSNAELHERFEKIEKELNLVTTFKSERDAA